MKRDIIIIEDKAVSVTGNEIWMTSTEIAGLFHTGVPAVNAAIRAVRKPDVLTFLSEHVKDFRKEDIAFYKARIHNFFQK